jgi:hypothetical protein
VFSESAAVRVDWIPTMCQLKYAALHSISLYQPDNRDEIGTITAR